MVEDSVEKKATVLIVDDSSFARQLIREALSKWRGGWLKVLESETVSQAQEIMQHHKVDVIFLDLVFDRDSGQGFLAKLRRTDKELPVVIVTACGQEIIQDLCRKLGISDWVCKPFSYLDIHNSLERCLAKAVSK